MTCRIETAQPEPFEQFTCPVVGEPINPCRHAMPNHESATDRLWLSSQIRETRRENQWAKGYVDRLQKLPRPALEHEQIGWDAADHDLCVISNLRVHRV